MEYDTKAQVLEAIKTRKLSYRSALAILNQLRIYDALRAETRKKA